MEMNMVAAGDLSLPSNVTELRVPIHFKDALKVEGLKVFQTMMFNKGSAFDLWWTGQEFKDMRLEACEQMLTTDDSPLRDELFDVAIGHFHDLCPLAMARKVGVKQVIWITHGTSVYDYTAVQIGLRTFPSFVPHPLSSYGDRMSFADRLINLLWHLSTLDFVNLPQNLLYDENTMLQQKFSAISSESLWQLSQQVRVLLVNGERFLDFPRPLPTGIAFMGEVGKKTSATELPHDLKRIVDRAKKGFAIFSLGTVSNTTNMPPRMISSFVQAFGKLPDYEFIWRMEMDVPEAESFPNIHLFKWLPQKDLMRHPKLRLLIAHGGYNSFLEAAQAGVPIFINAKRAQRFGIAEVLDKLSLTPDKVGSAVEKILGDSRYADNARKLARMLADKPATDPYATLRHALRLSTLKRDHFAMKAAQRLTFIQFHNIDVILWMMLPVAMLYAL